uniref:Uncharacterized protein n=1 Tax=Anguilla anguilla TaxID=7936 RepID=A0A0E9QHA4_ANGAN
MCVPQVEQAFASMEDSRPVVTNPVPGDLPSL